MTTPNLSRYLGWWERPPEELRYRIIRLPLKANGLWDACPLTCGRVGNGSVRRAAAELHDPWAGDNPENNEPVTISVSALVVHRSEEGRNGSQFGEGKIDVRALSDGTARRVPRAEIT